MKKIIITTGGTGGHVIPAKIIDEHLKNDFEVYFSTDSRGLKYLKTETNKIIIIDTPRLNINFYFPLKILKVIYLIFKALIFLKEKKISKVISIGGYMSLPIVLAAKILGLTIILFEPNLVLGRSNRLFLNSCKKIFCYSRDLSNFPEKYIYKIELIKPLISKVFYQSRHNKNINKKFCILISGGSQGALVFDELMKEVISDIAKNFSIKVIQQTSQENVVNLKKFYEIKNIENKIFSFEEKFIDLINSSDFCITRAGANSLAEISFLKKPFLAIPLPYAKDNHQMKNAQFYEKMGCCWVLDQKTMSKEKLLNILLDILNNKDLLMIKKTNLEKLNYKDTWNDVNQKLKNIIDEN